MALSDPPRQFNIAPHIRATLEALERRQLAGEAAVARREALGYTVVGGDIRYLTGGAHYYSETTGQTVYEGPELSPAEWERRRYWHIDSVWDEIDEEAYTPKFDDLPPMLAMYLIEWVGEDLDHAKRVVGWEREMPDVS